MAFAVFAGGATFYVATQTLYDYYHNDGPLNPNDVPVANFPNLGTQVNDVYGVEPSEQALNTRLAQLNKELKQSGLNIFRRQYLVGQRYVQNDRLENLMGRQPNYSKDDIKTLTNYENFGTAVALYFCLKWGTPFPPGTDTVAVRKLVVGAMINPNHPKEISVSVSDGGSSTVSTTNGKSGDNTNQLLLLGFAGAAALILLTGKKS